MIKHLHCPPSKIERVARLGKVLVQLVQPGHDAPIDHWLHSLDIGEAVRAGDVLAERGVSLVRAHVEQGFGLAEAARDVVTGLVGITVVDFGEFGRVSDEEEGGSDADDGSYPLSELLFFPIVVAIVRKPTIFLGQRNDRWQLRLTNIVPCDPQTSHAPPEWTGKDGQGVEEAVIDDLVCNPQDPVSYEG